MAEIMAYVMGYTTKSNSTQGGINRVKELV